MKELRKISALVLALVMVLAMNIPALAATNGDVYTDDSLTAVDTTNNTIPMTKSIIMFNINGSQVYEPNITYTYSVAPVTETNLLGTITDDGEYNDDVPVTVKVNAGVTGAVYFTDTNKTIAFSSNNTIVTTEANGVEVEKSTKISVTPSAFTHAGVYRYKITETDNSAAVTAAGMVRGSEYSSERYLDVYIKNGDNGLELFGAVIFKTNAVDNANTDATTGITTTTGKTTGFEPDVPGTDGSDVDYTDDKLADHYTTYDFTVKKAITGNLADLTHNFPFYVNVTNTITGAAYTYFNDPGTGDGAKETIANAAITKGTASKESTLALKDGEYVKFVGVPSSNSAALSIVINEWNDSVDQYTASLGATSTAKPTIASTNGDTAVTNGVMTAVTGSMSTAAFDLQTNDIAAQILTVTNNLAAISPTGYVARFAPYALILVAGIALLVLAKKRKPAKEE